MGALAGLLREAGHHVTGSDTAFYPPMGDALKTWGVETFTGFDAAHLSPRPDLVVIGNVCRKENPEARAAIDGGMTYDSMAGTIERLFLDARKSLVVAGTHGKTTTTALVAHLLDRCGAKPGFLIGGIPLGFTTGHRRGETGAPFVIEGDEYDSAFFEKTPKFWRYRPYGAIVTSIEHDHIDIYKSMDSYRDAFREFVRRIPDDGVLVAWAGDPEVRAIAKDAKCRVAFYALSTDDVGDASCVWTAAPFAAESGVQAFDIFVGGTHGGRVHSPLAGHHNVRNALAAIALCAETCGPLSTAALGRALSSFKGIKRRQELRGSVNGVRVFDDFAHHPTAVRETISAMKAHYPGQRVVAIFEPRSATASRAIHQAEYVDAFMPADWTILAPVGRSEIAENERLNPVRIAEDLVARGRHAEAHEGVDSIVDRVANEAKSGDIVLVMSNGAFGGIHQLLLDKLDAVRLEKENHALSSSAASPRTRSPAGPGRPTIDSRGDA